ncbi:MAG: hypothetical protein AAB649_01675 [Patescibacteria group bacterium]
MKTELEKFCEAKYVRISCKYGAPANPEFPNCTGYTVTLKYDRRQLTVPFYQRFGTYPSAADVLSCLLSDTSGYDFNDSFEDWCSEYGYDTDSRRAKDIYEKCRKISVKLHRLLDDDFDEFARAEH